ncbi:CD99 molecule isoform X2 [Thalassophryne amazonica]|uniref:CD99 molecule isoform X2 n=1 Tax=Thalassophryne amazonica TaxID=390379 RepID=UPI0014715BA9|nr:CD99 molecule isoform X2 [Thalassophryne amazonica]
MMKVLLTVVLFLFLVHGARAQELDLSDFFDKPNEPPKATEKPKNDESKKPAGGGELDLSDVFDKPNEPPKVTEKPKNGLLDLADALLPDNDEKNPVPPKSGGGLLDLADALLPDNDEKNPVPPKSGGGISDSDLIDVLDGYKPDGGSSGGRSAEGHVRDTRGGGDEKPQDPDFLWGQILKMLNTNMPEEFYMWISNLKQILIPLLERAMDLLQTIP